ncbi:MAG: hypothetical protein CO128_03850, partial [Ignavibacteriales bacterium CG_4_9_14_3_um_filter_30_11]
MLNKFAQELRKAREKTEITLQNLSARSRLDIKFLQAMENGDFSFLPEIYVKAFIKDYAKFIGLNVNETIKKYEAAKKGIDYTKIGEVGKKEIEKEIKEKKPDQNEKIFEDKKNKSDNNVKTKTNLSFFTDKKNVKLLIIAGVGVIILSIILFSSSNNPEIIIQEKPYEEVRNETQQRYIENKPTTPVKNSENLVLQISATDKSWIKVQADLSEPKEFTIFPGTSVNLNSKEKFVMT